MTHKEYAPDPALQSDVRCLWLIDETQEEYNRDPVLPDSYVELIFNCGAPTLMIQEDGASFELPPVFIGGLQQRPTRYMATGAVEMLAVRFYAWSVQPFFDLPEPMSSSVIALDGWWKDFGMALASTVQHQGHEAGIDCLQQVMLDAQRGIRSDLVPIRAAGEQLYASRGQATIEQIAADSFLSLRQLERRFKQITGTTPKSLARLIRFEAVRNCLYQNPARSLLDLVYEYGYTDQAHLIHDFKTFSATTPRAFSAYVKANFPTNEFDGFLQYL